MNNESFISLPEISEGQNWQTYMIVLSDSLNRRSIIDRLREVNIETNLGAQSMSMLKSFELFKPKNIETPVSNKLYQQGLALPLTEQYDIHDIEKISKQLIEVIREHA